MRFILLMITRGRPSAAPATIADAEGVAAMTEYNQTLQEAGVLLALDALYPPSMGARVTFADGESVVSRSPSSYVTEAIGGYWLIEVESRDRAIEWARRCPALDNDVIEIRQVQEFDDLTDEARPATSGFPEMQSPMGDPGSA